MRDMGVGKSLEKKFEKSKEKRRIDALEVLESVTNFPCQTISKIAERLRAGEGAIAWHLKKLEDCGLVARKKVGGRILYYQPNVVQAKDVEEIALLQQPEVQNIIQALIKTSGLSKKGLMDTIDFLKPSQIYSYTRYLERLVKAGFVKVLKDRKMNYYYLTKKIFILYKNYTERESQIAQVLIRKLGSALPNISPGAEARIGNKTLTNISTVVCISKVGEGFEEERKLYLNPLRAYAFIQLQQF